MKLFNRSQFWPHSSHSTARLINLINVTYFVFFKFNLIKFYSIYFISVVVWAGEESFVMNARPTLGASTATATGHRGNASVTPTGAVSCVTKVSALGLNRNEKPEKEVDERMRW